jgi:hypothetical protein
VDSSLGDENGAEARFAVLVLLGINRLGVILAQRELVPAEEGQHEHQQPLRPSFDALHGRLAHHASVHR